MKTVELLPISIKFKRLRKEFGVIWNVKQESEFVICFSGKGILIESIDGKHIRWVKPQEVK